MKIPNPALIWDIRGLALTDSLGDSRPIFSHRKRHEGVLVFTHIKLTVYKTREHLKATSPSPPSHFLHRKSGESLSQSYCDLNIVKQSVPLINLSKPCLKNPLLNFFVGNVKLWSLEGKLFSLRVSVRSERICKGQLLRCRHKSRVRTQTFSAFFALSHLFAFSLSRDVEINNCTQGSSQPA